jgi:hypothetical protein
MLVLSGPIDAAMVSQRWQAWASEIAEFAVCYELPVDQNGFRDALAAQRAVTQALRRACGQQAETIAIFAVTDREGERVGDYAREWGATEVSA